MLYSKETQSRHWPHLSRIIYKTDPVVGVSFSTQKRSKFSFKPTKTHIQSERLTQLVIVMLYHLELLFFVNQKIMLFINFYAKKPSYIQRTPKTLKPPDAPHNHMNLLIFIIHVAY